MTKSKLLLLMGSLLFTTSSYALSPAAEEGKLLYPTCHVCHNQQANPPLGPPMWGVQRRYQMSTANDAEFVKRMVDFVKAPTLETAIHADGVQQLGLMPPLPLPDVMLEKISTYILEEKFPPPCDHWTIAIKKANERGDPEHAKKDQANFDRYCK
jgi:hypothetical protein